MTGERPARSRAGAAAGSTRPTLAAVAEHAKVSRQTVSNALNAPERLRPETLHRVRDSIRTLRYSPNHAARTLRTQATRLIACRLLPVNRHGVGNVLDAFLHALCNAAREQGYDILTFSAGTEAEEIAVYDDLLRRQAVDAVVLTESNSADSRVRWLLDRHATFVLFGRPSTPARARHSWVDVDGAAGVTAAVEHLLARGHRRIGFIGWPEGDTVGDHRFAGWSDTLVRHRLPRRGLVVRGAEDVVGGAALAARLLDRALRPSALMCVSDTMAIGAMRTLEDRGLRAGRDVAVVGFDDTPIGALLRPALSSVWQPLEVVAAKVVEVLLGHLRGGSRPTGLLVPPTLVVRDSSAPA